MKIISHSLYQVLHWFLILFKINLAPYPAVHDYGNASLSIDTLNCCLTVPEMYQPHFALDQHTGMCLPASCLSSSFYPPSLIRVGWYPIGDHPIKYSISSSNLSHYSLFELKKKSVFLNVCHYLLCFLYCSITR